MTHDALPLRSPSRHAAPPCGWVQPRENRISNDLRAVIDPRDQTIPIRASRDVVGHYRSVQGDAELEVGTDANGLFLRTRGYGNVAARLREDGRLELDRYYQAELIRRGNRTLLRVDWVYQIVLYERSTQ